MVKSNKQRLAELKAKRTARKVKTAKGIRADQQAYIRMIGPPIGSAPVNAGLLALELSYRIPEFVTRGYYEDRPFTCRDCGKDQVWTATQQKWWYEIAKGGPSTTATRCRPCRKRERDRAAAHKQRTEEGIARKAALKLVGKWRTGL